MSSPLRNVEAFDPDAEGENSVAPRPILRFPDPRLRLKAEPIMAGDEDIRVLAQDLTETMHAAPGIGITAAHIGVLKRLVVIQLESDPAPKVYINPLVVWTSPNMTRHMEGSVSMPGVTDEVERPSKVRVAYRGLDGAEHEEEAEGLMAVCLQHEIDQLDGIFWIDRLSRLKRDRLIKRFEKLQRVRA
jgi:peptide deformylase